MQKETYVIHPYFILNLVLDALYFAILFPPCVVGVGWVRCTCKPISYIPGARLRCGEGWDGVPGVVRDGTGCGVHL